MRKYPRTSFWLVAGLIVLVLLFFSCKKEAPSSPPTVRTTFFKQLGREGASCFSKNAIQTSDGGYACVATSFDNGSVYSAYVVKTNSEGETAWTRVFGAANGFTTAFWIGENNNNKLMMLGNGQLVMRFLQLSQIGDTIASSAFGMANQGANYFQKVQDGGFVIAGLSDPNFTGDFHAMWAKVNSNGGLVWKKEYGQNGFDLWATFVQQTRDGGYILCVVKDGSAQQMIVVRADENGDTLWTKTFSPVGNSVFESSDGTFTVAGTVNNRVGYEGDAFLLKLSASGDSISMKVFSGVFCSSMCKNQDGGYTLACVNQPSIHLIRVNAEYNQIWERTFSSTYIFYPTSIIQTTSGGFLVSGTTQPSVDVRSAMFLLCTDSEGNMEQ